MRNEAVRFQRARGHVCHLSLVCREVQLSARSVDFVLWAMCLAHSSISVLVFLSPFGKTSLVSLDMDSFEVDCFFVSPFLPKKLNAGLMAKDFPLLNIFGNVLNYVEIFLDFSCVKSHWMSFYSLAFELAESVS